MPGITHDSNAMNQIATDKFGEDNDGVERKAYPKSQLELVIRGRRVDHGSSFSSFPVWGKEIQTGSNEEKVKVKIAK